MRGEEERQERRDHHRLIHHCVGEIKPELDKNAGQNESRGGKTRKEGPSSIHTSLRC